MMVKKRNFGSMKNDSQSYWNQRYKNGQTGWDIGAVSTPIKEYIDQLNSKELKILIPGAGNAHEAQYLFENGFNDVHLIDIAPLAIDNFRMRCPDFPSQNIIQGDFFEMTGQFDLILEQTFFCALSPEMREKYVLKMHDLLTADSKLVGLFFNCQFEINPPYGGDQKLYEALFQTLFKIELIEKCHNSIKPRVGKELFMIIKKETIEQQFDKSNRINKA